MNSTGLHIGLRTLLSFVGLGSGSCPSKRILELAQHKESRTIWITTVCPKLTWGNQELIWPLSYSALGAVPTERIQYLAKHKRKEEVVNSSRKTLRPSSKSAQYERIVRLSTPKIRSQNSQDTEPPHISPSEYRRPVWHIEPGVKPAKTSPRLLQLATPKGNPHNFQSNIENVETKVSYAAKNAKTTPRLDLLSVARWRASSMFFERGQPEDPIWPVSRGARHAKASLRLETLSASKGLNKDYIPPRDLPPL
ncbi:testicular haploid expressed gene protein-like isoform X2 [Esox lucius]|uniref:testicular haploid expressed gene protein-like isoform X2 n=1 Tax=Esox lucius TaxID=8010 RepID=UPI000577FD23|nr:testicular haploid expressed gene protein-like isoform X2 [Esox lucius]